MTRYSRSALYRRRRRQKGRGGVAVAAPPPPATGPTAQDLIALEFGTGTALWYPQEFGELGAVDNAGNPIVGVNVGAPGTAAARLGLAGYSYSGSTNGLRFAYPGSPSVSLCPNQAVTLYVLFEWDTIAGQDTLAAIGDDVNSWVEAVTSNFRNVTGTVRYLGSQVQASGGNLFGPSRGVYAVTFVYDVPAGGGNEKAEIVAGHTGVAASAYQSGQSTSSNLQGDDVPLDFFFVAMSNSADANSSAAWHACVLVVEGQATPERTAMSQMLSLPGRVTLPTGLVPSVVEFLSELQASTARDAINSENFDTVPATATRDGKTVWSFAGGADKLETLVGAEVTESVRSGYVVFELNGPSYSSQLVDLQGFAGTDRIQISFNGAIGSFTAILNDGVDGVFPAGNIAANVTLGQIHLLSWEYDGSTWRGWIDGVEVWNVATTAAPSIRRYACQGLTDGGFVYYHNVTTAARSAAIEAELSTRFNVGTSP